jgi:hypothetical protein
MGSTARRFDNGHGFHDREQRSEAVFVGKWRKMAVQIEQIRNRGAKLCHPQDGSANQVGEFQLVSGQKRDEEMTEDYTVSFSDEGFSQIKQLVPRTRPMPGKPAKRRDCGYGL